MKRAGLMLAALVAWQSVEAADMRMVGELHIGSAWARELPPVAENGAVYLTITNEGESADRLVSATSPIADRVELHETTMNGGVMRMRPVEAAEIAPGETLTLEPGHLHLMLIKIGEPLVAGKHFPVTLEFAESGSVEVMVTVERGDVSGGMDHGDHSSHGEHASHATAEQPTMHEHHGDAVDVAPSQAPSIVLRLQVTDAGAAMLELDTQRFRFAREHVDGPRVMGEGHAHLYIDGTKIGRIYEQRYPLPALESGVREIVVSLHANDHAHYTVGGVPVADTMVLEVPEGGFQSAAKGEVRRFELDIHHGELHGGKQTLRVTQGDPVSIRWSSDSPVEVHLHGYDIEAQVSPGSPVTMRFDALATGRFPIAAHGAAHEGAGDRHGHESLAYLEVHPR